MQTPKNISATKSKVAQTTPSAKKPSGVEAVQTQLKGKALIHLENASKSFQVGEQDVEVLKGINLEIQTGDFVVIFGASGSGKSTLLHIILGLEGPTTGSCMFMGSNMYAGTNEDYLAELRKKHIGMVYQQANWIKALSVVENIAFPLQLLGMEKDLAVERARQALAKFDLQDWSDYYPTELSSGQQQRISMARAIIHNPMLIVADEPTGNLDYENGVKVMELLTRLNKEEGKTVIMVTHDLEYLSYAHTAVQIFDGKVVGVFTGKDKYKIESMIKNRKQLPVKEEHEKD